MSSNATVELIEEISRRTQAGTIAWKYIELGEYVDDEDAWGLRYVADTGQLALTLIDNEVAGDVTLLIEDARSGQNLRRLSTESSVFLTETEREALTRLASEVHAATRRVLETRDERILDMLREKRTA